MGEKHVQHDGRIAVGRVHRADDRNRRRWHGICADIRWLSPERASNVDDQPAASAARELKAAARDVVRLGSQWAHTALNWVDERRNTMSNRNRDDRGYDEHLRPQDQHTQGNRYQQGTDYGQPDASARQRPVTQGRDRDIQGGFSGGNRTEQARSEHSYYGSPRESAWRELPGSGGSYASQGLQGHGPGTGAGSQGFGPEGYGTQRYEGQRYEGADYEGIGYGASQGERFGSERHGSNYGQDLGSPGYGGQRAYGTSERWQDASESDRQRWAGREQRPYGEQPGYGLSNRPQPGNLQARGGFQPSSTSQAYPGRSYASQGYDRDQPLYGQQEYGQGLGLQERGQQDQGWRGQTGYRGIGPKNYARSDERIREDLNERLTDADEIDASGITVEVSQGVATLSGTVEQRWMKHRAEDLAESCSGVRDVHNQIRVQSHSDMASSASRSAGSSLSGTGSSATSASPTPTTGSGSGSANASPAGGSSTSRTGGHA
jgi:hypothetical protein